MHLWRKSLLFCQRILAILLAGISVSGVVRADQPGTAYHAQVRILVDSIHAHNALHAPSDAERYTERSVYGYRCAFGYLRSQGVRVDEISSGTLTAKTLAVYRMVFINLVSADLPPFRASEIFALKRYVASGGSLLIITDHDNYDHHADRMRPLLKALGIRTVDETVCDRAPATLGKGYGWIVVTRFLPHPVTVGIHAIGMETAGTVDDRYTVARTSPKSWGDRAQAHPHGKGGQVAFYGNWRQDPGERHGPLGVVLAKRVGRGRIEIAADQNMWGDPFINYADNYRLWLNSVAWLTSTPRLVDSRPYRQWHGPRIVTYDEYPRAAFGNPDNDGYNNLFVAMGRRFWVFGGEDLSDKQDLILFANDSYQLSASALAGVVRHLRSGRNVVILSRAVKHGPTPNGVVSQIAAKLGAPAVENNSLAIACKWTGCGQVVMFMPNNVFVNSHVPSPERKPDADQQRALNAFFDSLSQAMTPPVVSPDAKGTRSSGR